MACRTSEESDTGDEDSDQDECAAAGLPPINTDMVDYATTQRNMVCLCFVGAVWLFARSCCVPLRSVAFQLASPQGNKLWEYWQRVLARPLPLINLPTDFPRPPIQTYKGAHYNFDVPHEVDIVLLCGVGSCVCLGFL